MEGAISRTLGVQEEMGVWGESVSQSGKSSSKYSLLTAPWPWWNIKPWQRLGGVN